MGTVFWDAHRIVLIEYMSKGTTKTGNDVENDLTIMQRNDSCRAHKAGMFQAVINECIYEELQHPLYSRPLATTISFQYLKKIQDNVLKSYFADLPECFFEGTALFVMR